MVLLIYLPLYMAKKEGNTLQMDDALSLVTNVGFPAGLCFILLRHILHTMEEKLDKLDLSLHELIQVIQDLNVNNSPSSKSSKPDE